ncbi:two-component sensor histidine kinase [Nocardioides psychrotolerans]|uniref:Sensor histidine kinase MtrB n=1 Tax=Nocardioides psychrotolerans TaxID=1005945 RepID=A0A1I3LCT8_9ACTN|nr:MtrAB system histidine kinase MtrB [Nocardioides psychrotolerans]GEP38732.1 two-component sensor histidine kinase [Nocardioides psychrotolerans]SFI82574.1 two-component system, OmpR family, sensor histidine kinase MtrB [Nocardioides psychrotolerans]
MARLGVPPGLRRALTFWRRSIQARVVASTLLLSAAVISGVGWFLLSSTKDGLLEHRVDAVLAEAEASTEEARNRLEAASGTEVNASRQQRELADQIIARGDTRGFSVVLGVPAREGARLSDGGPEYTTDLDLVSVPETLQQHFDQVAPTAWTYTTIRTRTDAGDVVAEPGIVVGSQIILPSDGNTYTFYFLFPLDEEQETLGLVTRALFTAAAALLILVAGITWLVARQVVTPIRMARQVAERLASGRLQERLRVTGEDDLARLATSFNQMASNLQRQIRQLEELSRVQRRFVSDVSHELRTPLTTVRMAGDVLHDARASFDPVTARAAELLQVELDRFEVLLADLLEISRFDAGAAVLEADDVNLVDVAHRVVDATRALADQRGVRVVVESPGHPCLAEADVRRVERIIRNLITNAIDHADTGLGEEIKVLLGSDDHAAAIAVRDYGVGLAPGESAMVFNRFWRADPARARTSGGTGLGLSIALEDTHLHGGWLQAWGRPGQGAQFRLTLPRRAGDPLRHSPLPLVPVDADDPVPEKTR